MDDLATPMVATPTDVKPVENDYNVGDLYVLVFCIFILICAISFKSMIRKMYINLIGGRKGE